MSSTRNSEPAKNAKQNSSNMSGFEAQLLVNVCVLVVRLQAESLRYKLRALRRRQCCQRKAAVGCVVP